MKFMRIQLENVDNINVDIMYFYYRATLRRLQVNHFLQL